MTFFLEDDLLPISLLSHFVFCPRRAALHHIEGIWEDNVFTVEGTVLHEKADIEGKTESRGDLRISRGLRLRSLFLGLVGKMDIVEFHKDDKEGIPLPGIKGLWKIFPVEYKRGILRHETSFEIQLCAQALCLEECFQTHICEGAIFYGKSERRYDVIFSESLRQETKNNVFKLHEFIKREVTPSAEYEEKCDRCSLLNLCLPKRSGRSSVKKYLEGFGE